MERCSSDTMDKEGKRVMIRREFLNKERTMKGIRSILSVIGVVGLFSLFLFNHSAIAQQRLQRDGQVMKPKHVVYDTEIDGIPTQETFVYSSDGLFIPAVVQKPKGEGPFPAVVLVHGGSGGQGMKTLKGTARNRNMVGDRFLNEGYVVVKCDYRWKEVTGKEGPEEFSMSSDLVSVIRYTKQLTYVDAEKVCMYSGSHGSENSVLALGLESVAAAVLNSPAGFVYMRMPRESLKELNGRSSLQDILTDDMIDRDVANSNLKKINSPTLFVVGTADSFLGAVKKTNAILNEFGKESYIDVIPGEKHGFYWGPKKIDGKYAQPSPAFLKALEKAVTFCRERVK
jgi:dipeptidyl aminopeptidase/acylaminoacyl peptidase